MRELHSLRFNVAHAYGMVDGARRSMAEIILLTHERDYQAKVKCKEGGAFSGKIVEDIRLETFRFISTPDNLRECAKALTEIANGLDAEMELLFPNKPQHGDKQTSFLDPEQPAADVVGNGE